MSQSSHNLRQAKKLPHSPPKNQQESFPKFTKQAPNSLSTFSQKAASKSSLHPHRKRSSSQDTRNLKTKTSKQSNHHDKNNREKRQVTQDNLRALQQDRNSTLNISNGKQQRAERSKESGPLVANFRVDGQDTMIFCCFDASGIYQNLTEAVSPKGYTSHQPAPCFTSLTKSSRKYLYS